jgi:hypothetical protein
MAKLTAPEIPPCPAPGDRHRWLMAAANACRRLGMTESETNDYLHDHLDRRPNPANEIEVAVEKVFQSGPVVLHRATLEAKSPRWPSKNVEQIEAVCAKGIRMVDLWELSPVRLSDDRRHTTEVLAALFPNDPLLCAGSKSDFFTDKLSDFTDRAHTLEQIVPSPMLAKYGYTQKGTLSQHSLEATGSRRFLVIEGDGTSKDQQAAVIMHLAEKAPHLALVVDSGSKSLHGWFYCQGVPDEKLIIFFRYAVTLGADKGMWTRSQFARMPDGTRDNGRRQSVLYFNAEVCR